MADHGMHEPLLKFFFKLNATARTFTAKYQMSFFFQDLNSVLFVH